MKTIRTVAEMRAYVAEARHAGRTVGLVPTMGAFHAGHHSLMRAARERCDEVVVWLFVNPKQFDEAGDLAGYPRDEARDAAEAAELGVDVLFAPSVDEVYPPGFATAVHVAGLSDVLEGAIRGVSHFTGVCTVVTKMLNMVTPDLAFFGQKDAQQVAVLRRMVRDLNMPVELAVMPTVREPDGLALSSRNARLDPADRDRAVALSRGLRAAEAAVADGERDSQRDRRRRPQRDGRRRARVPRAGRSRQLRAGAQRQRPGIGGRGGAHRRYPPHRQHRHPHGGDPGRGADHLGGT